MKRRTRAGSALALRTLMASAAIVAFCSLLGGAGALAGQEAHACDDRAGLRIAVLDAAGMVRVSGADVRIRWVDVVRSPVRKRSGDDGGFTYCAPRDATKATVWAESRDGSSEQTSVELIPGETSDVELRLLGEDNPGRLEGRVFDAVTKDPVINAAVTVAGRPTEVETDRWGRYILTGVPAGAAQFEVRRMGYEPLRQTLDVTSGLTTQVDIGLVPDPAEMEPLVATTVRSRRLESKGFYERRYWGEMLGTGEFLTPEDLDRSRPINLGQLILQSGLRPPEPRGRTGLFRGCLEVYRDNTRVSSAGVHRFVTPGEPVGVEIYRAPAALQVGLTRYNRMCDLVLIWTA